MAGNVLQLTARPTKKDGKCSKVQRATGQQGPSVVARTGEKGTGGRMHGRKNKNIRRFSVDKKKKTSEMGGGGPTQQVPKATSTARGGNRNVIMVMDEKKGELRTQPPKGKRSGIVARKD